MSISDLICLYETTDEDMDKTEWVYLVNEWIRDNKKDLPSAYLHSEIVNKKAEDIYKALKAKVRYLNGDTFHANKTSNKVFIVHGHDEKLLKDITNLVKKAGYEPIVLSEQANCGNTIIEKLEKNICGIFTAIILYTGCDEVMDEPNYFQARPNVIFEYGLLLGRIGRHKLILVNEESKTKLYSDIHGISYVSVSDIQFKLISELHAIKQGQKGE